MIKIAVPTRMSGPCCSWPRPPERSRPRLPRAGVEGPGGPAFTRDVVVHRGPCPGVRGRGRPDGTTNGHRPSVAVDRSVDHTQRPDLRRHPRQRVRSRLGAGRRPVPTGPRARRRGPRRRVGELRPRRLAGRRAPITTRRSPSARSPSIRATPATVYCGTGEGDWWSWLGTGMLRSHRRRHDLDDALHRARSSARASTISRRPGRRPALLAGTNGGLYVSTDGGVTWTRRRNQRCWSLAMRPAARQRGDPRRLQRRALRSTNGGRPGRSVALPGAPATFDRLASPSRRSNPASPTPGARRAAPPCCGAVPAEPGPRSRRRPASRPARPGTTGSSPSRRTRDTQIYLRCHRGAPRRPVGRPRGRGRTSAPRRGRRHRSTPTSTPSPSSRAGPTTIYVGNDGGVYRSPDRGDHWQHCNNGLVISEFEYLAQDLGSSRWLHRRHPGQRHRARGPARSRGSTSADGDGGDCGVNRSRPATVLPHLLRHEPRALDDRRRLRHPGRASPPPVPPARAACSTRRSSAAPPAATPSRSAATRSTCRATTAPPGPGSAYPAAGTASALYIPNADTVYRRPRPTAGSCARSWNGGAWSALDRADDAAGRARPSATSSSTRGDADRIWATSTARSAAAGCSRSDDGGSTWTDRTAGLPALPINAIQVDPANRNRVWVAADLGVYQTRDGGASWTDFANGLPNCFVGDLIFHPHARVLRAGTRNRGVWEIPVDGWHDHADLRRAVDRQPRREPEPALVHVPLAGHLARRLDGDADHRRSPAAPQVTWTRPGRAGQRRVRHLLDHRPRNLTAQPVDFEGRTRILSRY